MINFGSLNNLEKPERRGWFLGNFIEKGSIFHNDNFEVCWGNHKKGWKKDVEGVSSASNSLAVLVSGVFLLKFRDRSITLAKPGDYCFWSNGVFHKSECIEDSVIMTLRWITSELDEEKD